MYTDGTGVVRRVEIPEVPPGFGLSYNFDFHYFDPTPSSPGSDANYFFFVNGIQSHFLNVGSGLFQIPTDMGLTDIAFAGVDVSPYRTEHLRNPPDPNPAIVTFDCSVYFDDLDFYRPNNLTPDPYDYVWKPWKQTTLDAELTAASGSGLDSYRSNKINNTSFYSWNVSHDVFDPCGDYGD